MLLMHGAYSLAVWLLNPWKTQVVHGVDILNASDRTSSFVCTLDALVCLAIASKKKFDAGWVPSEATDAFWMPIGAAVVVANVFGALLLFKIGHTRLNTASSAEAQRNAMVSVF